MLDIILKTLTGGTQILNTNLKDILAIIRIKASVLERGIKIALSVHHISTS